MKILSCLFVLALLSLPAAAQSLDELPPDVAAVSLDAVAECKRIGGKAQYEPLNLVKYLEFRNGEAYLIDTRALRCKGGKNARKDGRVHCRDTHCEVIVMTAKAGGFAITFRDKVTGWSQIDGDRLEVYINNETIPLVRKADGMAYE